tara:strand:- start:8822 stop:9475 length:654 start_codon:yes stop_codon:yes gene_type:complete
MAYSPITVGTGTIDSSDVQGNLDKMKNYVDGSIVAADLGTTGWCESKHIVRGHYDPITNQHTFVSGINSGYQSRGDEKSFICDGPTSRDGVVTSPEVNYPNTTITFELEAPANVMFQYHAAPISPPIPGLTGTPLTEVRIFLDSTKIVSSGAWTFTNDFRVAPLTTNGPEATTNMWSGFYLAKNLAAGKHSLGLRGLCQGKYTFLMNWSVSMEAYYL